MNDHQRLRIALRRMQGQEGSAAVARLLQDSALAAMDDGVVTQARRLRRQLKAAAPGMQAGPKVTAEILASVGRLMNERDPQGH